MKRQKEIKLSDEEKSGYQYLPDNGDYCSGCGGICKKGVVKTAVKLNSINDIVVEGNCAACGHKVARVMEFGEDKSFFEKAVNFREMLQN